MHAAWRDSNLIDLSELLLLTQIRPAFMFASAGYIKHPKNDKELVTIATDKRLIMQMGLFTETEKYKMWRGKPPNEPEWTHLSETFYQREEYDLRKPQQQQP